MKKTKILSTLFTIAGVATVATPLVTLSSCNKDKKKPSVSWNLMEEYQPVEPQLSWEEFRGCKTGQDAVDTFINGIPRNYTAFKEDILYTLSRGVKEYNAYLESEGVNIVDSKYGIKITDIIPDPATGSVRFTAEMSTKYNYTGTDEETLARLNIKEKKYNKTTKYLFNLDFQMSEYVQNEATLKRNQISTYNNVAQIGICEVNSTITVLKEGEASPAYHFIEPSAAYWNQTSTPEEYTRRLEEIGWLKDNNHYPILQLWNHYLGTKSYETQKSPNTINFGSYHMGQCYLYDTLEFGESSQITDTCYGFNFCNSTADNWENLENDETIYDKDNKVLHLPTADSEGNEIKRLYSHAFDATLFEDHDNGLPNFIETIVIPCDTYLSIGEKAIAYANDDNELATLNFLSLPSKPMTISANAFYNLNNVSEINFDMFDPDDCDILNGKWAGAFSNIHIHESEFEGREGAVYLPEGWDNFEYKEKWLSLLTQMGIKWYETGDPSKNGWELLTAE